MDVAISAELPRDGEVLVSGLCFSRVFVNRSALMADLFYDSLREAGRERKNDHEGSQSLLGSNLATL